MVKPNNTAISQCVRDVMMRTYVGTAPTTDIAESLTATVDAAQAAAAAYVPHQVTSGLSHDEVGHVARKIAADQPLDERESNIAEAIILPDLRPAIDIVNNDFVINHPAWPDYRKRTKAHTKFARAIPSVGRVELLGSTAYPYGGTCFVVGENLVMTNRHVAQLFANGLGTKGLLFVDGIKPGVDFLRERGDSKSKTISFCRMRMIHPFWDLALIEVDGLDGHPPLQLVPTELDARQLRRIAVIGYPAFDSRNPAQVQDQVFRGTYNIKRFQPGLITGRRQVESFGKQVNALCHDSSTLGGNSGSVVLDAETGDVIGLHFAGSYRDSNFAVTACDLACDGRIIDAGVAIRGGGRRKSGVWDQWWLKADGTEAASQVPAPSGSNAQLSASASSSAVSITLPLTITVTLGQPAGSASSAVTSDVAGRAWSLDDAAAALAGESYVGVVKVKPGFNGRNDCLVVAADPKHFEKVQQNVSASFAGHPVIVRYATIDEQLGLETENVEAPGNIAYDDARRTGSAFAFDQIIDEPMRIIAHVGPEQSFSILKSFLGATKRTLVSSMYQFFAEHIAESVEEQLTKPNVRMSIVLDPATRDTSNGVVKLGEFDRSSRFDTWRTKHKFKNIYVLKGNGGLVNSAYHIKVTVRDASAVWLSSGNWTRTSQPEQDPQTGAIRGNREWHIVVESKKLAAMFAAHIEADFQQCIEMDGGVEAPEAAAQLVDVPEDEMLAPLVIQQRKIKVQPILTPDRCGRVYTEAVLGLIRSATDQLVFQNQYIKIRKTTGGNLEELVEALIERSKSIRDLRVILRAGDVDDDIVELRRRGMDVMRCVRVIANTHTKGIVVDGKTALVGSQNWSEQAVATNRDASLLFDDAEVAGYFKQAFEIDWARARPAAGAAITERPIIPATGLVPPPGYIRMTLDEYRNG